MSRYFINAFVSVYIEATTLNILAALQKPSAGFPSLGCLCAIILSLSQTGSDTSHLTQSVFLSFCHPWEQQDFPYPAKWRLRIALWRSEGHFPWDCQAMVQAWQVFVLPVIHSEGHNPKEISGEF